jgi:acetyl-CoA carboxylase biotin carboxyl carrier protein
MPKLDVDARLVRKLAALLEETGLTEIEYAAGGEQIRVSRQALAGPVAASAAPARPVAGAPIAAGTQAPARAEALPAGTVCSPMVGMVYIAPNPEADPFVKIGDRVTKGQTLLIIEAMKVMNPIPAPRDGTVAAVLVEDKQPVEYGEPLIVIE